MKWEQKTLGEIINLKRGYDLPRQKRKQGFVPIISSSGTTDFHSEPAKTGEGVVTGRYGTLGQLFYINGDYWPLNTTLYVQDFKGNVPRFIYYFLKTLNLEKFNGASAVPGLDRNVLHKVDINYISHLPTQRKIASILSAYDDLIENNLTRIKLLEEQLAIKYSLLERNCKHNTETNFSDFVTFAKGVEPGSNYYLSQELEDSIPFIRVGDLSKRESNIWIERIKSKGAICDENDILISMDGTVGVVKYGINGCYSSGIRKAVSNGILNNAFIFCYLTSKTVQSVIYAHSIGSTIQHAGSSINYFKIRLPKKDELTNFINYSDSVFSMLLSLHKQNTKLREARDILLPRLMSGQIEV